MQPLKRQEHLWKTDFFADCGVAVLEDEGGGNAGQLESLEKVSKRIVWFKLCPKDQHQPFGDLNSYISATIDMTR